ncbi:uncharacterized protein EAE97_009345 [Botrytis byssoidea]|uniref:Uncharacterized protein n=1 Tax=Botrytis byssoidea TaxID=139641 RepID=A0A9P5LYK0_9HELO|nr:uncharacterized protein EAE97_009345 [Botrytis byssoidea]KAF7931136.1 hypothetical protein EAE97_009345 [Botrytis byssoidea]
MSTRYGPALQIHKVGVGYILWLPPLNATNGDSRPLCQRHTGMRHLMNINVFDHPAVVLNIHNRYDPDPSIRFIALSLYRGNRRSQCGPRYCLENGQDLEATSNFHTCHRFVLSLSRFDRHQWGRARSCDYRLNSESYTSLMARLRLDPEFYHSTSDILNGFLQAPPAVAQPFAQQLQILNSCSQDHNSFAALERDDPEGENEFLEN